MLKDVSILVNQQNRQIVERVTEAFEEVLAPLKKIGEVQRQLEGVAGFREDFDEIRKKMASLVEKAESVRKRTNDILELQEDALSKLTAMQGEVNEFKTALKQINWEIEK